MTAPRTETFETPRPIAARISAQCGWVDVQATDEPTTIVELRTPHPNERAAELIARVRVELDGDQLVVDVPARGGFGRRHPDIAITVRLPIGSTVRARLATAQLTTRGELGGADVVTASGDVQLGDVTGDVTVHSASGSVRTGALGGNATVRSASGTLHVGRADGALVMHSASGDIRVGAVTGGMRAKTASGDIEVVVVERGELELSCASGDVTVGIAPGVGAWLDLSSLSGTTRSDLHVGADAPASGATARLTARTLSGDVTVTRAYVPQDA